MQGAIVGGARAMWEGERRRLWVWRDAPPSVACEGLHLRGHARVALWVHRLTFALCHTLEAHIVEVASWTWHGKVQRRPRIMVVGGQGLWGDILAGNIYLVGDSQETPLGSLQ